MCTNRQAMIIELSCIRQLVFELHFFGPMTDPDEIRSLFSMLNPYWQITETKSENREITHRVSRKQNPEKFLKS